MRRTVAVILAVLAVACLVSLIGVLLLYVAVGRPASVPSQATLVLRLSGDLADGDADALGPLLPGRRPLTVRRVVDSLGRAKRDRRIAALMVRPSALSSPYLARVQEIRDALLDFRASGKPVVAFLEDGGQTEYYLATACSRIVLAPASPLQVTGVASYSLFLRGLLDKIDAYPDLLHIGAYKTASNQFTEKTFTAAHREMAESLNQDAYEQLVAAVASGRKKTEVEVRDLLDQGPFLPAAAAAAGLVDQVAYEDQLSEIAKLPADRTRRIDLADYDGASASSGGFGRGARIAVLHAVGTIVSGRSGYDALNGPLVGSDSMVESIRRIRESPDIRAVVLHIDSPGGSAVASDTVWRELVLLRDAKPGRPLVASMSDLAASGGYYLAMAAPQIVAEPGTLTGSIGIFGGKFVTGGTYAKLGATIEGVSHGRHADMHSPVRPYSPEERAKLGEQLQDFYDQFVERVAASRHMTPDRVDALAQGRVWTGRQAKKNGLVDELGGLERALALARQRAGLGDREVEIEHFPPRRTLFDLLAAQWGGSEETVRLAASWLGVADRRTLGFVSAPLTLFRHGEALALMPFGYVR